MTFERNGVLSERTPDFRRKEDIVNGLQQVWAKSSGLFFFNPEGEREVEALRRLRTDFFKE